jgi:methylamine dehydrogenase heavy chain
MFTRVILALFLLAPMPMQAELEIEIPGRSETLPSINDHWLFVGDMVLRRSALFDAESGRMLGMLNGGQGVGGAHPRGSRSRGEFYMAETVYSRGHRGERTDLVTIYDAATLGVLGEVVVPSKRADNGNGVALTAVLGDRFLLVFNQTPATSVSVVDLEGRSFVTEIATAGCALVFETGPRSFGQLCGDGTAQRIDLDDAGLEISRTRSEPFFDATNDPVTEKGVQVDGSRWLFVSFDGFAHEVDFSGERPSAQEPWSLFSDAQRTDGWLVGGNQHLALHRASGRLFSAMHQGERGSHKAGGPEVWVYSLSDRARTGTIEPSNLTAAFLRGLAGIEAGSFLDWVMSGVLPAADVSSLAVSQDASPLLFLGSREIAGVSVHDALTGEHLRDIESTGVSGGLLVTP